ncbi:MAG: response regulator [Nannocystaceae bacterium]|nr:response regulator [bacterium]
MGLRLLIVDDDESYWELIRHAFARSEKLASCMVDRDASGSEFLSRLESGAVTHDLVLLDQRMPEKTGTEVLAEVSRKRLAPTLSICLMSSSRQEELVKEAMRQGARFCFAKPDSLSDLLNKFEQIVGFYEDVAQLG